MSEQGGAPADAERARGSVETVELSAAQQSFARRAAEAKATAPHVYFERTIEARPTPAALVGASAAALRELPVLNGAYRDGRLELYSRVNVAFSVEVAGTLVQPVIHDADRMSPEEIADEIESLGARAREGTLTAPALAGATFTVVDMSPGGVTRFTPVIARGQAATLGAGTEALTLACDARIVQAGEGADFLGNLVARLGTVAGPLGA